MKKIGIMGGTFNPIHYGHLAIALAAYKQFALEEILFLPSRMPPHKKNRKIASNEERMDMVELALEPYPSFRISNIEMLREGFSYTADTVLVLKEMYPDQEICFIIGADSLHDMDGWYKPQLIFDHVHILFAPRFPTNQKEDFDCRDMLIEKYHARIDAIEMQSMDISSKDIVSRIQQGETVEKLLPKEIISYIKERSMFQEKYNYSVQEIQKIIQKDMPENRFFHTLGVANTAACLAMQYRADFRKARLAGLLHDCAKCIEDKELLMQCKKNGIEISKTEEAQPSLLHGKFGAYIAKTTFFIEDSDILNAITFHTTGRPNMSLLEKIIFIADYIEPGRRMIPGLDQVRELVFRDLDKAVYITLENTLNYLNNNEKARNHIDSMTINAYNYYKILQNNESNNYPPKG